MDIFELAKFKKIAGDGTGGSTAPKLQAKRIYQNGVIYPDVGYVGMSKVEVKVALSDKWKSVIDRTVTEFYEADFGSDLTGIGTRAFSYCSDLSIVEIPEQIKTIGIQSFAFCTSLETVDIRGVPYGIDINAFLGCDNLTEIYVDWSEGEVAGAPWGATNATIYYS